MEDKEIKITSNYVYGAGGMPAGNGVSISACNISSCLTVDSISPTYNDCVSYSSPKDTTELKLKCLLNKAEDLIVACLDSNRVMDQNAAIEFLNEWRKIK